MENLFGFSMELCERVRIREFRAINWLQFSFETRTENLTM